MQKLTTFLFFFFSFLSSAIAQPALHPNHWVLDPSRSDEFNETALDTTKWWPVFPCHFTDSIPHGFNGTGGAFYREQNVSLDSGNLIFKVEYNPDSADDSFPCFHRSYYPYYSGGILSVLTNGGPGIGGIGNYRYGYYEMRAKLPGFYYDNKPSGRRLWPAFWLNYQYPGAGCIQVHDEFDIIDSGPDVYGSADVIGSGWSDEDGNCGARSFGSRPLYVSPEPLFTAYHKYGLELLPDRLVFYFDDVPYYATDTISHPEIAHSLNIPPYLSVVMSIEMEGGSIESTLSWVPFPLYMYVDYFRFYQERVSNENELYQNYPNPVTENTIIRYDIGNNSLNSYIEIYSELGSLVKSFRLAENGTSSVTINREELPAGIYFYYLKADNSIVAAKKMIVMK